VKMNHKFLLCRGDSNKSKEQVISIFSVENCSAIASHTVVRTL
jgi:hypothetical protein